MQQAKESPTLERDLIVDFLRNSATRILGKGMADPTCDTISIHWMTEALELAANAIEKEEHLTERISIDEWNL